MTRAGRGKNIALALVMGPGRAVGGGRAPCRGKNIALALVMALAAAACAGGSSTDGEAAAGDRILQFEGGSDEARGVNRPVVQVPSEGSSPAFLDPGADPSTDLGRLRAQHLPVWTSDFDWAFPPETCGTAWELDGIAEPTLGADIAVLGDFATAAALTVMRYEHQFSRALAEPSALAQLCVATASVEPARSDALNVLKSYLATGARRFEPAVYPDEVWIIGVSPTSAISAACVTPGYPTVVGADGTVVQAPQAPSRLQAYLLTVSRGLEDEVADNSYRVSNATHRPAEDCSELYDWAAEWDGYVQTWVAEGQLWEALGAILTAEEMCIAPPREGPDECPRDWPR